MRARIALGRLVAALATAVLATAGGRPRAKPSQALGNECGGVPEARRRRRRRLALAAIAEAFKRYGMIVADNGSNWCFQGATDRRWSDDNLNQLKEIPGTAFEVVRSQAEPHVR